MSPTIHREHGLRFYFFSNEEGEPPHVHVARGEARAKFWLMPPRVVRVSGFSPPELRRIRYIVEERAQQFIEAWHEHKRTSGQH